MPITGSGNSRNITIQPARVRRLFVVASLWLLALLLPGTRASASEYDEVKTAVPVVLDGRLAVQTAAGSGEVPVHVSRDWTVPQPGVKRVVIIVHGWPRRDIGADDYLSRRAGAAAGDTLFITPQFLVEADVAAHHLSPATLRWSLTGWRQGYDAQAPAAISSFDVIDAIFRRLADKALFPDLSTVVLAGHSAGGQFVQRYAVAGQGEHYLGDAGVHVRYVVANPAAYLYFDDKRMQPDGSFVAVQPQACKGFNDWNLGFDGKLPRYMAQPVVPAALQQAYLKRDVIYLLGTADSDPHADSLGMSCRYKIQGASRYERGQAYLKYLASLPDGSAHRVLKVPDVSHHSYAMYASTCGQAALFDTPGCEARP